MYEEAISSINWQNVAIRLIGFIILIGILLLSIYLLTIEKPKTSFFEDNLTTMTSVAKNYYNKNDIEDKITLREMIDKKMVLEFIDEDGKQCDVNNSYAKLENNKLKVFLTCNKKSKTKMISI